MYNHFDWKVSYLMIIDYLVLLYSVREVSGCIDHSYKPIRIDLYVNNPIDHIQPWRRFLELSYRFLSNHEYRYPSIHISTRRRRKKRNIFLFTYFNAIRCGQEKKCFFFRRMIIHRLNMHLHPYIKMEINEKSSENLLPRHIAFQFRQ